MFEYFKSKKIMIIVPHQDDELNIVGGLLTSNYFDPKNIFIAFVTNGDYLCNYKARIKEVIKVSKKLKIPFENIIFLGYADQHVKENNHIYNTYEPNFFISKKGYMETFSNELFNEYHYKKYKQHSKFNYENILNDYIDLTEEYKPDVLFTIDFDSHPDHRASSLLFDAAMGIVLKKNKNYNPLVYKSFAYPTNYKGINDFNNINFNSSKFKTEPYSICEMQNPYYEWDERIRFSVDYSNNLFCNPLYNLLKKYRSQLIIKRAYSIINSDVVFWQRRTDNLCLFSKIIASSGETKYLNDFMLFDVEKLTNGDKKQPVLKNACWIPLKEDKNKEIQIIFPEKKIIDKVVFYQNIIGDSKVKKISIELSSGTKVIEDLSGVKSKIYIKNEENISWIKIKILESIGKQPGFSEIEIFSPTNPLFEYFNIDILDCFINKKIYTDKKIKNNQIKFYYYDGIQSKYFDKDEVLLNQNNCSVENINYGKNIFSLKNNKKIYKEIKVVKNNNFIKLNHKLKVTFNNIILKIDIFISRVLNKIDRILKRL